MKRPKVLLKGAFQVMMWTNEYLLSNVGWKPSKETFRRTLMQGEGIDPADIQRGMLKPEPRVSPLDPFTIQSSNWIDPNCNVAGQGGAAEILETSEKQVMRYIAGSPENGFSYDKLCGTYLWVQGSLEWFRNHLKKRGPYIKQ